MLSSCVWLVCLAYASLALASWRFPDTDNEWHSPQTASLGGIGVMSTNFVDQTYADPSSAAWDRRSFALEWFGLGLTWSQDLQNSVQDFTKLAESNGSKGSSQQVEILDKVQSLFGKNLSGLANVSLFGFRIGGFTMVPQMGGGVLGHIDNPSWPDARLQADFRAGVLFGLALAPTNEWQWGFNIRPLVRMYATVAAGADNFGSSDSGQAESEIAKYGASFYMPLDWGIGWTPNPWLRLHFAVRDFLGAPPLTSFTGTLTPPAYPMRISTGAVAKIWQNGLSTVRLGTELLDMEALGENSAFWYRWRMAGQYLWRLPFRQQTSFALNLSEQSGYWGWGVFLDFILLKFEYVNYTRESGLVIGNRPEQRKGWKVWSQMSF